MAKPDSKELFETFRAQLQCFACKTPPGPREKKDRYLCLENNHPLCVECKDSCPCGSRTDNNRKPCDFLTKMMDSFPWYHCYYYEIGCREILNKDDYEDHMKSCIYRKVNCALLFCQEKIASKDIVEHVRVKHRDGQGPIEIEKYSLKWTRPIDKPSTVYKMPIEIVSDGMVFYAIGYKPFKISYFWLYINASESVAKNYEYTLTMSKDHNEINFKGQPHAMDKYYGAIVENEEAFCIGESTLNRYTYSNPEKGTSTYSLFVKIRSLKTEAKDEDVESGVSDVESDQDQSTFKATGNSN